ncbi:RHS repeat-associated core domain-containing protein [Pseudomonas sp. CGJS7]|uniref:RHS repeat-associated core domain-containing protein n=1 Tax=Pseudomonas sp. CGJS7 TaxID=3109348 RepID=UPI0030097434
MDFTNLLRGALAAACLLLLSGRVVAAGPEVAKDQFCTTNHHISPSTRCFDALHKAEGYLRTEPSPAVGRRLLVRVNATADVGKNHVFRYAVKSVHYDRHLGDLHEAEGSFPYDCGVTNIIPGQAIRGCLSEQALATGLINTYFNDGPASSRFIGQYISDPPPYWYNHSRDESTGLSYAYVVRNLLPQDQDRKIVITRTYGEIIMPVRKRGFYQCRAPYTAEGRASYETSDNPWPNICANYERGEITKISHQNSACKTRSGAVGNPCVASTGNKEYRETDFSWDGIEFARAYNSIRDMTLLSGMDDNWAHTFSDRLRAPRYEWADAYWQRSDGYYETFVKTPGGLYRSKNTVGSILYRESDATAAVDGRWRLVQASGRVLRFNDSGNLIRIEDGTRAYALSYCTGDALKNRLCDSPVGTLYQVASATGRTLRFAYTVKAARIGSDPEITSPLSLITSISADGVVVASYEYDDFGRLIHAALGDQALNQGRSYAYAEPANLCKTASGASVPGCDPVDFPYHLTSVLNENGALFAHYTYDGHGRATSSEHAGGVGRVTLNYLPDGKVEATLPGGATRKFEFDANEVRQALSQQDVATDGSISGATTYTYSDTRMTSSTSGLGNRTNFEYDDFHLVNRVEALTAAGNATPQTRKTSTDWHATLNRPIERRIYNAADAVVSKDAWTYNLRGQVQTESKIDPVTNQVRLVTTSYCEQADVAAPASNCPVVGLVKSVDGPRTDVSDVTTYKYYAGDEASCATSPATCSYRKGDLWTVTNAAGQIVTEVLRYDYAGRALSTLDVNGVLTNYEYDPRGRMTATKVRGANDAVETDDRITKMEYWPTGTVKKVTLPDGVFTTYTYDGDNRLTDIVDNAGNTIHYTLDADGNREKEDTKTASGTLKRTLSRVYNQLSQLHVVKDASGNPTTLRYDADGNQDRTTDALGRITDQDHDPLGRLSRTLQDVGGLNVETNYEYNALDQITKVTDPKRLNTHYRYNGFGDQVQLESPDTGITDYTYNAAGLVATKKDANDPVPHSYTYDALNRPKTVSYTASGPADVEYDYDTVNSVCTAGETFAIGRVTAMRTDGTELKYCYDRFGQVTRKVQTVDGKSLTLRYAYTLGGQLSAVTYPDGAVADYVRDGQGRVKEVGVTPAGGVRTVLLTGATYEPFGPVAGWTYGNGRTLARTYDQDYRAKSIYDPSSGGLSLHYGYNEVGELVVLKDGLQSATLARYDYDSLGRLTVTRDGPTGAALETYGYDGTGNRTSLLRAGTTDTYSYPADSHRLTSAAGFARGYDAVGNTTSIGAIAKEFVYNANDQIRLVKLGGVAKMNYRYNVTGEKVAVINEGSGLVKNYTLYDEKGLWAGDYDSAGLPIQQVVWMGEVPVGLLVGAGGQSVKYIQPDPLGSPRSIIDPVRNVAVWSWGATSEAFGNNPPNQDPDMDGASFVFNLRFPGQSFDALTGLSYNYFRDYDTSSGRYLQSDPIGLSGGLSTYSYANSSPLMWFDRHGLAAAAITPDEVSYAASLGQAARWGGLLNSISAAGGGTLVRGAASCPSCVAAGAGGLLIGYVTYNNYSIEILDGVESLVQLAARGNKVDTQVAADYNAVASAARLNNCPPPERCEWLKANAARYRADQVRETAKAWGCKGSRHTKGGKSKGL